MRSPRGAQPTFRNFQGGLNTFDSVYELKENEGRAMQNMVTTARGGIFRRGGIQVWSSMAAQIKNLYPSNNPKYLIATSASVIYSIDPAKAVVSCATGLTNAPWQFANAPSNGGQGPIYGMNGTEARYTNGTLAGTGSWTASAGTLPIGKFLIYNSRRMFISGMSSYLSVADPGSTVVVSNLGNPRDFAVASGAGYILELDPNDGEAISGMGTIGPYVIIFKPSKAWLIYDLDTGANRRLGQNVGCVAARSIVETPIGTFFLTKDQGVQLTDGQRAKPISDKILPTLALLNAAQAQAVAGSYWNQHYYLSLSQGGSNNDLLLDYDLKADSWWPHTNPEQDLVVWQPSNTPLLFGSKGGAQSVRQLMIPGLYQDDVPAGGGAGTNFTANWKGPFQVFGAPHLKKRMHEVRVSGHGKFRAGVALDFVRADPALFSVSFPVDSGSYGVNDGSLYGINDGTLFGAGVDVATAGFPISNVARAFSLVIVGDTNDPMEMDSYTMAYTMRRD